MDTVTFLAGISALTQAVQTWYAEKSYKLAAAAFDNEFESKKKDPEIAAEAENLARKIPQDVLEALIRRANNCVSKYKKTLTEEYLPEEHDSHAKAYVNCVCRELARIEYLDGSIPSGALRDFWKHHKCQKMS